MNLVGSYDSESETEQPTRGILVAPLKAVNPNPDVSTAPLEEKALEEQQKKIAHFSRNEKESKHLSGNFEQWHMNDFSFNEQYHNFVKYGVAMDPNPQVNKLIVTNQEANGEQGAFNPQSDIKLVDPNDPEYISKSVYGLHTKEENEKKKELSHKRKRFGNASSGDFLGPWASYEGEEEMKLGEDFELDEERKQILSAIEEKRKKKLEEKKEDALKTVEIQTIFHGDATHDYKGRSYILPPLDLKPRDHTCYIPKKPVHTWSGHTKGVQVARFFPKYGHFILSGSHDTKVKLWDVYNNRKCVRTYMGHSEAVRDICFTNDGLHFLSASYDKTIHYWDTETGKVVKTFQLKKFPYNVRFHPDDEKQYAFLCASSNKKIGQYDVRTGNRTQQYDEHLGPVNTVTFIDGGRKFVSTSDDKKIFLWEFGIPVVVKHISEPEMHSITATAMHPSGKYFAGQSSDNKIVVYDAKNGNFKLNRKKQYSGHLSAGYAIGLSFSPDKQFIASGDQDGKVFFWDWKSAKTLRTYKAHEGVCIGVDWHPIEPSKFATCGWDGTIKLWD